MTMIYTAPWGHWCHHKLVVMMELPQLTTQLLAEPAPTNDDGCYREGMTGELRGGGPCQEPCLPLADALPL